MTALALALGCVGAPGGKPHHGPDSAVDDTGSTDPTDPTDADTATVPCGEPVVGPQVPIPSVRTLNVGGYLETVVGGTNGALAVYYAPEDATVSDTGSIGGAGGCWAVVLDPAGAPTSAQAAVDCAVTGAWALADGWFLQTVPASYRVRSDGVLVELGSASLAYTALDHGDDVRTFAVESSAIAGDWDLVRRDLADDGTVDEVVVASFPSPAVAPGFTVGHDGAAGVLIRLDWQSTGTTWIQLDADGALVGDWADLAVPGGGIRDLLPDEGPFRGVHCTPTYRPSCSVVRFDGTTSAVGAPTLLEPGSWLRVRAGGASVFEVRGSEDAVYEVPLTGLDPGTPVPLLFPFDAVVDAVDTGAGVLAIGVDDDESLLAGDPVASPTVIAPSVAGVAFRESGVSAVTGPAGSWLMWAEDSDLDGGLSAVEIDPLGAPIGSAVALDAPGASWAGVVTEDGAWMWTADALWSIEGDPADPVDLGPPIGHTVARGAWLGDGGVAVVPDWLVTRLLSATGDVLAEIPWAYEEAFVRVGGDGWAGDPAGRALVATEWWTHDATGAAHYDVGLSTLDADGNRSGTALIPDGWEPEAVRSCGIGCWTVETLSRRTRVIAADPGPPAVEDWAFGVAGILVGGRCGYLHGLGDALAWAPDFSTAPTALATDRGESIRDVLPTGPRTWVVVEEGHGEVFTRSVTW